MYYSFLNSTFLIIILYSSSIHAPQCGHLIFPSPRYLTSQPHLGHTHFVEYPK